MAKRRADYQVQLELQRDQEKMRQKEEMREMRRHRDEESLAKQEQMRRQTVEYEFQQKQQLYQYCMVLSCCSTLYRVIIESSCKTVEIAGGDANLRKYGREES